MIYSMEFGFYKLFIATHDYILINAFNNEMPAEQSIASLVQRLCHRREGIGGMGVIFLTPSTEQSASMYYYTAEGDEQSPPIEVLMCGGRYAFDFGLVQQGELVFDTRRGMDRLQCIDSSHFSFRVGIPHSDTANQIVPGGSIDFQVSLQSQNRTIQSTPVLFNRAYAAIYSSIISATESEHLPPSFPIAGNNHTPVLYQVNSSDEILLSVPGISEVLPDIVEAAAAAGVAAVANGFCDRDLVIRLSSGGRFFFEWNERSNSVYLAGTPHYAFSGSYSTEDEENQQFVDGDEYGPSI
jgi:diaminopimelate epimerase